MLYQKRKHVMLPNQQVHYHFLNRVQRRQKRRKTRKNDGQKED